MHLVKVDEPLKHPFNPSSLQYCYKKYTLQNERNTHDKLWKILVFRRERERARLGSSHSIEAEFKSSTAFPESTPVELTKLNR